MKEQSMSEELTAAERQVVRDSAVDEFTSELVTEVLRGEEAVGHPLTRRELNRFLRPISRRFLQLHERLEQTERRLEREARLIGKLNGEARRIRELHPVEPEDHSPRTEKKRFSWSWLLGW